MGHTDVNKVYHYYKNHSDDVSVAHNNSEKIVVTSTLSSLVPATLVVEPVVLDTVVGRWC
jgi:hypothetical protein